MNLYLVAVFAFLGLLLFKAAKNSDWKEVGRLTFFCGLFVFLLYWERWNTLLPRQ